MHFQSEKRFHSTRIPQAADRARWASLTNFKCMIVESGSAVTNALMATIFAGLVFKNEQHVPKALNSPHSMLLGSLLLFMHLYQVQSSAEVVSGQRRGNRIMIFRLPLSLLISITWPTPYLQADPPLPLGTMLTMCVLLEASRMHMMSALLRSNHNMRWVIGAAYLAWSLAQALRSRRPCADSHEPSMEGISELVNRLLVNSAWLVPRMFNLLLWVVTMYTSSTALQAEEQRNQDQRTVSLCNTLTENMLSNMMLPPRLSKLDERPLSMLNLWMEDFPLVTVCFVSFSRTDFERFEDPQHFLLLIGHCISMFDQVVTEQGLFKLEHVGEDYVVTSSCVRDGPDSLSQRQQEQETVNLVKLAQVLLEVSKKITVGESKLSLQFRAGLHSGPCVGAIAGKHRRFYRLFGDSVNTAARMCQHAPMGCVHLSQAVFDLVQGYDLNLMERGVTNIKGKGPMPTYVSLRHWGDEGEEQLDERVQNALSRNARQSMGGCEGNSWNAWRPFDRMRYHTMTSTSTLSELRTAPIASVDPQSTEAVNVASNLPILADSSRTEAHTSTWTTAHSFSSWRRTASIDSETGAEDEVELSYGSNFSDLGVVHDSLRTLQGMITHDRGRPVLSPSFFPDEQQEEVELNFGSDISTFVMSRDWLNAVKELNMKHGAQDTKAVSQETGLELQATNVGVPLHGRDGELDELGAGHDIQHFARDHDQHTRRSRLKSTRAAREPIRTLAPVREVDDWKLALPPHYRRTELYLTLQDRFSYNRKSVTFGTKVSKFEMLGDDIFVRRRPASFTFGCVHTRTLCDGLEQTDLHAAVTMAKVRQQLQICFPPSLQLDVHGESMMNKEGNQDLGFHGLFEQELEDSPFIDLEEAEAAAGLPLGGNVQPANPVISHEPTSSTNSGEVFCIPETLAPRLSSPASSHDFRSAGASNGSRGSTESLSVSGGGLESNSPCTFFRNQPADTQDTATFLARRSARNSGSLEVPPFIEASELGSGSAGAQLPNQSASFSFSKRGGRYTRISGGTRAMSCEVQVTGDVLGTASAKEPEHVEDYHWLRWRLEQEQEQQEEEEKPPLVPPVSVREVVLHHSPSGSTTEPTPSSAVSATEPSIQRSLSSIWADLTRTLESRFPFSAGCSPVSRIVCTSSDHLEDSEFDLHDSVAKRRTKSFAPGGLQASTSMPLERGELSPIGRGHRLAKANAETGPSCALLWKQRAHDTAAPDSTHQGRLARKSEPGRRDRGGRRSGERVMVPLVTESLDLNMDSSSPRSSARSGIPRKKFDDKATLQSMSQPYRADLLDFCEEFSSRSRTSLQIKEQAGRKSTASGADPGLRDTLTSVGLPSDLSIAEDGMPDLNSPKQKVCESPQAPPVGSASQELNSLFGADDSESPAAFSKSKPLLRRAMSRRVEQAEAGVQRRASIIHRMSIEKQNKVWTAVQAKSNSLHSVWLGGFRSKRVEKCFVESSIKHDQRASWPMAVKVGLYAALAVNLWQSLPASLSLLTRALASAVLVVAASAARVPLAAAVPDSGADPSWTRVVPVGVAGMLLEALQPQLPPLSLTAYTLLVMMCDTFVLQTPSSILVMLAAFATPLMGEILRTGVFWEVVLSMRALLLFALASVFYSRLRIERRQARVFWQVQCSLNKRNRKLCSVWYDLVPSVSAREFIFKRRMWMEFSAFNEETMLERYSLWVQVDRSHAVVLAMDMVNFTPLANSLTPCQVVCLLHEIWCLVDECVRDPSLGKVGGVKDDEQNTMFKMDTIGDAYITVHLVEADSREAQATAVERVMQLAVNIRSELLALSVWKSSSGELKPDSLRFRMGLSSDSVVAGVVGLLQPRYHVFGTAVENARHLESQAGGGMLHVQDNCVAMLPWLHGKTMVDLEKFNHEDIPALLEMNAMLTDHQDIDRKETARPAICRPLADYIDMKE